MAGYSTLSGNQKVIIELTVLGGPQSAASIDKVTASTTRMDAAIAASGKTMTAANEKAFLMRQGIFTMRRFMFYGTLAAAGMAFSVAKLGWEFNNTMQTARVGFTSIMGNANAANKELRQLYVTAALTPFQFPDIVMATRRILAFNHNVGQTNLLVTGLTNALSRTGLISAQYLGRASLALGHMFAQGRLTGRILYQMAQDNIPMQEALQKQFHMTGEEIRQQVAAGMITATQAAQALINLTQSPAYRNAAKMQATQTLVGAWSTFIDFMRMASASGQGGIFGFLTKNLRAIDLALEPLARGEKPITLTMVAQVIDRQLSPKTHLIINLFEFFQGVIMGVTGSFYLLLKAIQMLLWPFDRILNLFGGNRTAARLLGIMLGILATRWILVATWTAIAAAMNVVYEATGLKVIWTNRKIIASNAMVAWSYRELIVQILLWRATTLISMLRIIPIFARLIVQAVAMRLAFMGLSLATLGWIGLAIAVIYALVMLYIRWKAFRDIVNETATWLKNHWVWILEVLMPGLGFGIKFLIDHWRTFSNIVKTAFGWVDKVYNKIAHPIGGWFGKVLHYASYALPPGMGGPAAHQIGGIVPGRQWSLVGERGPELVQLPGGSRIMPSYAVGSVMPAFAGVSGGSDRPILVQVMLDRKVLAQGVARANQDYASRR